MALQQITEGKTGQEVANIIYQNDLENATAINAKADEIDAEGNAIVRALTGTHLISPQQIVGTSVTGAPSTPVTQSGNIVPSISFTDGKYLYAASGAVATLATFSYSDYIDISDCKEIIVSAVPENGGCFYDGSKTFMSGFGFVPPTQIDVTIPVPTGAKFVRVNLTIASRQAGTAYIILVKNGENGDDKYTLDWLAINSNQIKGLSIEPSQITAYEAANWGDNALIGKTFVNGKYLLKTGAESTLAAYSYVQDFIPVVGNTIKVSHYPTNAGCFYDSNRVLLSGFGLSTPSGIEYDVEVTIPENAAYVRTNIPITAQTDGTGYLLLQNAADGYYFLKGLKVKQNQIEEGGESPLNQWAGKKICWLGTSIPYGQGSTVNYPTIIAQKLGCTVINTAMPGQSLQTNQSGGIQGSGSSSLSISEYQALGVANPGNRTYENCLLGKDADLYVFDCEPNNVTSDLTDWDNFDIFNWKYKDNTPFTDHRKTYLGALLFMLDQLYMEKALARVVFVGEYGYLTAANFGSEYKIRTNTILAAEKLHIPYIDVWQKLQYNAFNRSLVIPDNVHPNAIAHNWIADMLAHELQLIG